MMPFDEIVENEKVTEKHRENYYRALADQIDKAVRASEKVQSSDSAR